MSKANTQTDFFERLTDAALALPPQSKALFIYPHVNADGDALGSALGLALILELFGVECRVLCSEAISAKLAFLPESGRLLSVYEENEGAMKALSQEQGMGLVIDSPGGTRIGARLPLFEAASLRFTIDHHIPTEALDDREFINIKAAASCEIICEYLLYLEAKMERKLMTEAIACNLFCGLMTDTGRFTYSNTCANTMRMAAELLRFPLDIRELSLRLFDRVSKEKLALTGYVHSHVRYFFDDKMGFSFLPYDVFSAHGGQEEDVEGLASQMRDVEGVELALLLRESVEGEFRASVRSGPGFNAQQFALLLGGGGHERASGFTLSGYSAEEALARCVSCAALQFEA